ncbi:autophagy-related 18a isoform e [Anaeramoeba flamelloides]|uniref:Autophagy-related 18a isoform e n=1 Tax=Anaeramoeba flamelloides TaxID=1746091 RepID=A0AAV7Z1C0_9EUKA|nr:autophagy-related 18a isoform e [Anaeramoeba flamelloides]
MNLVDRELLELVDSDVLFFKLCLNEFVTFGLSDGIKIYRIDPFENVWEGRIGEIKLVEVLSISPCRIAFVGTGKDPSLSPRKIIFYNTTTSKKIDDLSFPKTILSLDLNETRFIVNTFDKIHIYETPKFEFQTSIDKETNGNNVCALSKVGTRNLLAFPKKNFIQVYDLDSYELCCSVKCHNNPISCVGFGLNQSYLVTSSIIGTCIRVFEINKNNNNNNLKKIKEFKRGTRKAKIFQTSFIFNDKYLLVTSKHKTIHVFDIEKEKTFCKLHLKPDIPRICGISKNNENQIILITPEPNILIYQLDVKNKKLVFIKSCSIDFNQEEQEEKGEKGGKN